jgi:hypothetical protein
VLALQVAVVPAVAVKNEKMDTSIDLNCGKCGKPISGEVYEFKGVRICEDCYLDEVIAAQPKSCAMRR